MILMFIVVKKKVVKKKSPIRPNNGFEYPHIDVLKYNKLFVVDENNKTTWVGSPNWEKERERILVEFRLKHYADKSVFENNLTKQIPLLPFKANTFFEREFTQFLSSIKTDILTKKINNPDLVKLLILDKMTENTNFHIILENQENKKKILGDLQLLIELTPDVVLQKVIKHVATNIIMTQFYNGEDNSDLYDIIYYEFTKIDLNSIYTD